jgi:hypothetical protein
MSGITITIPRSNLILFQIDGGNNVDYTRPSSSVGILYPGERMDLLVVWPHLDESESYLTISLDTEYVLLILNPTEHFSDIRNRNHAIQNKAITSIHSFPISTSINSRLVERGHPYSPPSTANTEGVLDISTINGATLPQDHIAPLANQTILIYTKMEVLAHLGNVPAGFINRTSWAPQASPPPPPIDLNRSEWDKNQLVPYISISNDAKQQKWVDIVINNLDEKGHPFHLHGYDFYILAQYHPPSRGYHSYNPFSPSVSPHHHSIPSFNLVNPRKKDTVYIPAQGYVVLRILADNPGIWFFHCHVLWHSGAGMAMSLQIGFE